MGVFAMRVPLDDLPDEVLEPSAASFSRVPDSDLPDELVTQFQPTKLGQDAFADYLREELANQNWITRNVAGAGSSIAQAYEGLKDIFNKADESNLANQRVISEEAPVGALVGEVAKYAPVALAGPAILPAAGIAAGIGAATTPGSIGKRATSGAVEGGLTALGGAVWKAPAAIRKMGSEYRAQNALRQIYGPDADAASRLAARASIGGENVTTAQALSELDNPVMAALDRTARGQGTDPAESARYFARLASEQDAARLRQLEAGARGGTAAESAAARGRMKQRLTGTTTPMRESQLQAANQGAASLGLQPLDAGNIVSAIRAQAAKPGIRASAETTKALEKIAKQLEKAESRGLDAEDLYMIRKQGVSEAVDSLLRGRDPAQSKRLAAKLAAEINPLIDDAIEAAGGTQWRKYLQTYAKGMQRIDRVELLDTARQLYRTNPEKFMDLVKGERPEIINKIMTGKMSVDDALTPRGAEKLRGIAGEVARDARIKELAADPSSARALAGVIEQQGFKKALPKFLNRYVVLANEALKKGEMQVSEGMYKSLEKAVRDPGEFVRLMNLLPPNQRFTMYKMIDKSLGIGIPQTFSAAEADWAMSQ